MPRSHRRGAARAAGGVPQPRRRDPGLGPVDRELEDRGERQVLEAVAAVEVAGGDAGVDQLDTAPRPLVAVVERIVDDDVVAAAPASDESTPADTA